MTKPKNKQKEPTCICEQCPRRFICFTQEKVFSHPNAQTMFEGFLALGLSREEAIKEVLEELKKNLSPHQDNTTYPYVYSDTWDINKWEWTNKSWAADGQVMNGT